MTSERRIEANRRNAQLSTGPRTPEGKARVSQNAVKHGLTARHAVLENEDSTDFEDTLRVFEQDHQPVGPDELALVHRIADGWWRLRRLRQWETDYFHLRAPRLEQWSERFRELPADLRPSYIATCDGDGMKTIQYLSLLESRLERAFYRALHELERHQARRAGESVPPPVVAEIALHAPEIVDLKKQTQPAHPPDPPASIRFSTESTDDPQEIPDPEPERNRPPARSRDGVVGRPPCGPRRAPWPGCLPLNSLQICSEVRGRELLRALPGLLLIRATFDPMGQGSARN